jgi:hypothetical protein
MVENEVIQLWCNNQVAVAYIRNMGGRVEHLDRIAREIWSILEAKGLFMIASYINTKENPADALTRRVSNKKQLLDCEVQLNPTVFQWLVHQGPFVPQVDWFASRTNAQLNRFYVWKPDRAAEGVDAVDFFLGDVYGYIFPPFILIPRILRKIIEDKAAVILVHPDWPGALWAPDLKRWRTHVVNLPDFYRSPLLPDQPGPPPSHEGPTACSFMARWNLFDVTVWHMVMSSVAPSTKISYQNVFFGFVFFFETRGFDFESLLIEVVLSFFQKFVGLSTLRIQTVVAALKFFLNVYKRLDLVGNPLLDMC